MSMNIAKSPAATTEPDAKSLKQTQTPVRKPSAKEAAAIARYRARNESAANVNVKILDRGSGKIEIDYEGGELGLLVLMDAVGTADLDFHNGLISQLCNVNSKDGGIDKDGLDFMLAVIKDVKPRNQIEAMHAAQMAAVHAAAMKMAHRLAVSRTVPEQDSAERALNKLSRTFSTQMETLKRYRAVGPHTVQNVAVGDGGQAVVANITESRSETAAPAACKANVVPMPPKTQAKGRISA